MSDTSPAQFPDAARYPKRKIVRAVKLMAEARMELEEWAANNPLVGRPVMQEGGRRIDFVLDAREEPPFDSVTDTIGDALHNLRSALDYMVWTLAHVDGPPERPQGIQFPVSATAKGWKKAQKDLEALPPAVLDRLATLQPVFFPTPQEAALWHLHRLDIADKHRDYLTAHSAWEAVDNKVVIQVSANTEVKFMQADPPLTGGGGELVGWWEFSKPLLSPPQGTVTVGALFMVRADPADPSLHLFEVIDKMPLAVEAVIDFVCGLQPTATTPEEPLKGYI